MLSFVCLQQLFFSMYLYKMGELSLQEAMQQFLSKSRLKNGIQAVRIESLWEEMMGKTIAKYTEKIEIINYTLFIRTHVGPLKNELMFQKQQIIDRVNEVFGEKVISNVVIQ